MVLCAPEERVIDVRAADGKLLFKWKPETRTIGVIRKDKCYDVQLEQGTYQIRNERRKH